MDAVTLIGISLGLATDALAVAVAVGISLRRVSGRQTFRLSWHFGLFQFLMPVAGWYAGLSVERYLSAYDHWLAFGLLGILGAKMIREGFAGRPVETDPRDPTRGLSLVALSVATSVDALAVGLSLGVLGVAIWYPAAVIGGVACTLTAAGMHLGTRVGKRFGERIGIAGGAVLVAVGLKILVEHLLG